MEPNSNLSANMIKIMPIIKMFLRTIIITLLLARCYAAPRSRTHRSSSHLNGNDVCDEEATLPGSISVDSGEPVYTLQCPIESAIQVKDDLPANVTEDDIRIQYDQLKDKITITWLKNGQPWTSRPAYDMLVTKSEVIMYQVGETDAGKYTCYLDYSRVTRNYTRYFTFYRSASFYLTVESGLPNLKPEITHPPADAIARQGANITFTCNRTTRLSHQTTFWYKSCPLTNLSCADSFKEKFDDADRRKELGPLQPFLIQGYNEDALTVSNVSDSDTGYYGCAVRNAKGIDLRYGKLQLIDQWLDEQHRNAIAFQVRAQDLSKPDWVWLSVGCFAFLTAIIIMASFVYFMKLSMLRDKKQQRQQQADSQPPAAAAGQTKDSNLRQHLPCLGTPNIYNSAKPADGFISGHLHQSAGHILAQSICSNILDKKNPSISSSNSHNSDEASSSWGKSSCSHGDNCRSLYLHTSHATTATMPLYSQPISNGTLLNCDMLAQNSCINNPTYGFIRPENADWTFPRRNLDRLDKIGEGQFGEVWRYIARNADGNGDIVAVKQLKHREGFGDRERLELIAEIEIMKSVKNHPNVIKLLHYCIDEHGPILLIMEYAEKGKLQTYLRNSRSSGSHYGFSSPQRESITSKDLIKFTYHIAKGMEYIASQGIVHRDLASRNILVSKDKVCKVADFGFARQVNEDCAYERTTTNPVPVKWMAPEALVENKFTSKSDVFSLGILMWEIVTLGATPYEQLSSEGVYKKVTTGGRLDRPTHCSDEFYNLMAQCWLHDPALRPSFRQVAYELEKLLLSDNDYIKLDQYPEHAYYNIVANAEKEVVNIGTCL